MTVAGKTAQPLQPAAPFARWSAVLAAERSRPRPPWPGVAVAMAVLVVVLLAAGIFASTKTDPASGGSAIGGFALGLMFLIMAAVGLVVARFQRRNPIGYLLLGAALCFLLTLGAGGYAMLVYAPSTVTFRWARSRSCWARPGYSPSSCCR